MHPLEALKDLGLSDGEARVYLALLKLGSVTVARLKEETGLHRTTIYDFIEKLLNKGLASFVVKGGVKFFKAAEPGKLRDLIREKQEHLCGVLPDLEKLAAFIKEDISVEVYRGLEGFKTLLHDVIKMRKEFVSLGIDESKFNALSPYTMEQFFRRENKAGIHERIITRKGVPFVYGHKHIKYRYMQPEFFSPIPIAIYGNKVVIVIWEPMTAIVISNKHVAQSMKKYFELLWGIADTSP